MCYRALSPNESSFGKRGRRIWIWEVTPDSPALSGRNLGYARYLGTQQDARGLLFLRVELVAFAELYQVIAFFVTGDDHTGPEVTHAYLGAGVSVAEWNYFCLSF